MLSRVSKSNSKSFTTVINNDVISVCRSSLPWPARARTARRGGIARDPVISQSDPGRAVINMNTFEMLLRCFIRAPSPTVCDLRADYHNYLRATCGFIDARGHRIHHIVEHRKLLCYHGTRARGRCSSELCHHGENITSLNGRFISGKTKKSNQYKKTIIIKKNKTKFTFASGRRRP